MVNFNEHGYIYPPDIVKLDLEEFVREFVSNEHRVQIFEEYKLLLKGIKALEIGSFHQWIGGSFVTQYPKPRDIDVVTFLGYQDFDRLEPEIRALKTKAIQVDCYFARDYPEGHEKAFVTQFDKTEWRHLFCTDRKKRPKGFIQLNF